MVNLVLNIFIFYLFCLWLKIYMFPHLLENVYYMVVIVGILASNMLSVHLFFYRKLAEAKIETWRIIVLENAENVAISLKVSFELFSCKYGRSEL